MTILKTNCINAAHPQRRADAAKSISPEFSRGVSGTQGKCHPEIFISGQFPPPEGSPSPEGLHGLHGGILHGLHCFHGSLAGSHGWSGQRRRHLLVVTGKLWAFQWLPNSKNIGNMQTYMKHMVFVFVFMCVQMVYEQMFYVYINATTSCMVMYMLVS